MAENEKQESDPTEQAESGLWDGGSSGRPCRCLGSQRKRSATAGQGRHIASDSNRKERAVRANRFDERPLAARTMVLDHEPC